MTDNFCLRCWNRGTVIGARGNVELCPLKCAASQAALTRFVETARTEAMLGLVHAGHSLDTGRRNPTSGSEDDGIV